LNKQKNKTAQQHQYLIFGNAVLFIMCMFVVAQFSGNRLFFPFETDAFLMSTFFGAPNFHLPKNYYKLSSPRDGGI
jgi:ABC-type Fe3+-siderophore transport system permease subunit